MERCISTGGAVQQLANHGDILRFQRISAGTEQIQCLPIHEEDCFLAFMDNQLGQAIKVLTRVLPDESAVVTLIFDNLRNRHSGTS